MKEIDINIEGYNVNGICVGCLNYNRKMFYTDVIKDAFKIIANIDVPAGLSIQVCWECLAAVQKLMKFRDRVLLSFDKLKDYSSKYTFLNAPYDLSQYSSTSLSTHIMLDSNTVIFDKPESPEDLALQPKEEAPFVDVKFEQDDTYDMDVKDESFNFDFDHHSSEDDTLLAVLKKEDNNKKSKKGRKRKNNKAQTSSPDPPVRNKLKNIPSDITELYTMTEDEMWSVRARDAASEEFTKIKHKCVDCIKSFCSQKLMTYHFNSKHLKKDTSAVQCDVCKAYLLTKENISSHRNKHLSAYKCRLCGLVTTFKKIMCEHECAKSKDYPCSTCPKVFSSKSKLAYHKTICTEQKPQCDCCGKVFANKLTLKSHLRSMSGIPADKDKKPKQDVYIPCKGCDKVFYSSKSYRAHVVIHEGVSYPCPICGKLFQWKRNLARHTRNHLEREAGTTHQCRDCGKTFSSRDCYNNHMKMSKKHVGESALTHACQYCDKRFASKWCLVDHIDWDHLKRIKYRCRVCYKPFKTSKIMVAHMNNIHDGKNRQEPDGEHLCEVCGKSYKTVKRLKGHVWAMHTKRSDSKSFKCRLCSATFTWQTSIYKHMRMMHDNKRAKQPRALPTKKEEPYHEVPVTNRVQYFQQNVTLGQMPPINIVQNIV